VRATRLAAAGLALLAFTAFAAAKPAPRLGRKWGPSQSGYGQVRPSKVFNGGDPTGLVERIHWSGWGRSRATGRGRAE